MGLQKGIIAFPTLISIKKELSVKLKEKGKKKDFLFWHYFQNVSLHRDTMGWY